MVSWTIGEALAIQNEGQAAHRNAMIFSFAGGVFVAGGVALVVRGMRTPDEEPAASVSLTRGGATASYTWKF